MKLRMLSPTSRMVMELRPPLRCEARAGIAQTRHGRRPPDTPQPTGLDKQHFNLMWLVYHREQEEEVLVAMMLT
jgi:hypothetical protein